MTYSIWTKFLIKGAAPFVCAIGLTGCVNVCHATLAAPDLHPKWNNDWDNRESEFRDAKEFERSIKYCVYKGSRNIFLVRDGDADCNDNEKLSPLGKEQAQLVGERLKHLDFEYSSLIYASQARRVSETAQIIKRNLPDVKELVRCNLTHDAFPINPVPLVKNMYPVPYEKMIEDGSRLEAAFNQYFYRPDIGRADTFEIMVCPANVIRYFVCRALQFPPEAWHRMSLFNCSITWIRLDGDGSVGVRYIGNFSHMPPDKLTPPLMDGCPKPC